MVLFLFLGVGKSLKGEFPLVKSLPHPRKICPSYEFSPSDFPINIFSSIK